MVRFVDTIEALSFCTPVTASVDAEERGCAIATVSDRCDAIIHLEGLIDVEKEKKRIAEVIVKKKIQLDKLRDPKSDSDKIPQAVREANKEKASELDGELEKLNDALSTLSTMEWESAFCFC